MSHENSFYRKRSQCGEIKELPKLTSESSKFVFGASPRVDLTEVLEFVFGVRDDGGGPWFPAGGTNIGVCVRVLECLHQTQCLVHASPHREVVHRDLAQNTLLVYYEQTPQSVAQFFQVHSVVLESKETVLEAVKENHLNARLKVFGKLAKLRDAIKTRGFGSKV